MRELAVVPYERILPPRFHKEFAASFKLAFTRDGSPDIPVIPGSHFNLIVTNTEKIRIRKESVRKSDLGQFGLFTKEKEDEARAEVANRRLQAIAALPDLAVFSDEAHHTYGQSMETGLKRVRQTVDYLAAKTSLRVVANTTGTPYYQRQPLRDVVAWYGLSEGIADGILKDPGGNIVAYELGGDPKRFVREVVADFFKRYRDVRLPDGSRAKLALYFPQTDDVKECRPEIDLALAEAGEGPAVCLVNTSDPELTKKADLEAFAGLNHPDSPIRVVLLVNKGTEGWNCPSLFACALARKLKNSNNFVLQAATRCMRQVPGNTERARIYLSMENHPVLDRQLQDTYGESISELFRGGADRRSVELVVRKPDVPPVVVRVPVLHLRRPPSTQGPLRLEHPTDAPAPRYTRAVYALAQQVATVAVLRQIGEAEEVLPGAEDVVDVYAAAVELAEIYRLDLWPVRDELGRLYPDGDVPLAHLAGLAKQIEDQAGEYEQTRETVERALALVRLDGGGFQRREVDGREAWVAEITYPVDREKKLPLLYSRDLERQNPRGFGFHYDPYAFDSSPERSWFEQVIGVLNDVADLDVAEIEDVYYTGGLTSETQTDFFVEYRDPSGRVRRYTPDFVVRKRAPPGGGPGTGRVLIVEIKGEDRRADPVEGERGAKRAAMERLKDVNPGRLEYEMVFVAEGAARGEDVKSVVRFALPGGREEDG